MKRYDITAEYAGVLKAKTCRSCVVAHQRPGGTVVLHCHSLFPAAKAFSPAAEVEGGPECLDSHLAETGSPPCLDRTHGTDARRCLVCPWDL